MLLEVQDLKTHFYTDEGVVRAVDGVSLSIEAGKTLGIVGESGCGKSVTALSILRLLPIPPARIVSGKISFNGKDILALSKDEMYQVRGKDIAMIFQEPMTSLNPVFTIGNQIDEALFIHRPELSKQQVKTKTIELLDMVGIPNAKRRYGDYPHELSGGMRQRVMIAMALSCEPKLLLADEPTTALDVTIQAQILELIQKLQKERGMSVILITHDLGVVAEHVDSVMVMYAGRVVETAETKQLFSNPIHPYTKGLLASLPSRQTALKIDERGKKISRLNTIPGTVPDLKGEIKGCRFKDRCELAQESCGKEEPELEEKESDHHVSCFEV